MPPHWRQRCDDCDWDQGYEITAYFLEWLNDRFGKGTVAKLNQELRTEYAEDKFWKQVFAGKDVAQLWGMYAQTLADKQGDEKPLLSPTQSKNSEHESAISDHGDIKAN